MFIIGDLRRNLSKRTGAKSQASSDRDEEAAWENEGGSMNAAPVHPEHRGALFDQAASAALELARGTSRTAQAARTAVEIRRLSSRVSDEIDALGHDLYPLLLAGQTQTDVPIVRERMATIATLQRQIDHRKARMARLRSVADHDQAKDDSIANIDANIREGAAATQTAKDEAADASGKPTEEGGEG